MTALTEKQHQQFQNDGYLLVEDLFDPEEILDPLIDEYEGVMDRLAFELHREGAISSQYEGLDFSERVTKVYQDSGKVHAADQEKHAGHNHSSPSSDRDATF